MVTFDGIESHNEWEITFEEIHRNGDIAFAIYNYTRYTGDESYVLNEGSRVLTEMSRFWADRVHFSKRNGKYMIHGVTGPDEYENNVDNNWYTNYLAKWTLKYTLEIVAQVTPEVAKKLQVTKEEKQQWQDIVDRMYLPEDKKNLVSLCNTMAFWIRILNQLVQFQPINCQLINIGLGIKFYDHHILSRAMSYKVFGISLMTLHRNKRNVTLIFMNH